MYTQEAIDFFGTKAKLAAAVGVRTPTIYGWGKLVPEKHAYHLQALTDGALKYRPELYGRQATDAA